MRTTESVEACLLNVSPLFSSLDSLFCDLIFMNSLVGNNIGVQGGEAIKEAFTANTTLMTLE